MARVLQALGQLRQRERWTRPEPEAYQTEALRRLREHAYANSGFYQQFRQGRLDRPLGELPVLTKARLMEHFDELVTDPAIRLEAVRQYAAGNPDRARFLGRYWVGVTSGSSGHPGLFLFDRSEWVTVLASLACGWRLNVAPAPTTPSLS